MFDSMNERFFSSRLSPAIRVVFIKNLKAKHNEKMERVDGVWRPSTMQILIDEALAYHADCCAIALIHEMAHADLPEYIGYAGEGKHGLRYQAKLDELYKMGIYDGLL